MRHTPGPWEIETDNGGIRSAVNAGVKHIAMVNFYKSGNPDTDVYGDEHIANCHLIAAAPKLLACIEPMIKQLQLWMKDHGDDIASRDAIDKARAAIAKATAKGK